MYAFGVVLLELLLGKKPVEKLAPGECQSIITWVHIYNLILCISITLKTWNLQPCIFPSSQAMPYLTDRTKLPSVIDPAIKDTMDLKHLYQVRFTKLERDLVDFAK